MRTGKIAPSILAADFLRLGEEIAAAEAGGADRIHLDVMDGVFVPNISFGIPVVKAARRATTLPLEAHLMIVQPERYLADFANAGADTIIVHQEVSPHLDRTLHAIRELGKKAGVAINPATPLEALNEVIELLDLVAGDDRQPRLRRPALHRLDAAQDTATAPDAGRTQPDLRSGGGRRHRRRPPSAPPTTPARRSSWPGHRSTGTKTEQPRGFAACWVGWVVDCAAGLTVLVTREASRRAKGWQ